MFLRVIVEHTGCWSQLLSSYPNIKGKLIAQKVRENSIIEGFVAFYQDSVRDLDFQWDEFLRELKKQQAILKVEHKESVGKAKLLILDISAQLDDSMSDLVDEFNFPYFVEYFYLGYEIWYVYVWYETYNDFISAIKKRAKLLDLKKLEGEYLMENIIPFKEDSNYYILKMAYDSGYYESNKLTSLKDIAKRLNISKSNLSRKLKKSEKNAINLYIKTRFDDETLKDLKFKKQQ